jgi:hypothetical protein
MIEQLQSGSSRIVAVKLRGRLHDADYRAFVPILDAAVASQGKVRLLAQFEDFHGWDLHAAWDDLKLGVRHYADFERVAVVGDRTWEAWIAVVLKPFTRAAVKYFDASEIAAARDWLREGI